MKRWLLLTIPMLAAGLMVVTCGCSHPTAAEPVQAGEARAAAMMDRVTAAKPETKTLQRFTAQPGRVTAFEETPLHPRLTGYVQDVLVDIGHAVTKDQVLVRLGIPEMRDELEQKDALVAQAEAEVQQAEAALRTAQAAVATSEARVAQAEAGIDRTAGDYERWKAEHARIKELADRGSVTQKLVEETLNQFRSAEAARREADANVQAAQAAVAEAGAAVQQAQADQQTARARQRVSQANLAQTKTMQTYAEIRAPFDGVVTRRNVDTGHYAHPAAAEPLLVIARSDIVRVQVDVPEMEAALVDGGDRPDTATVRVPALDGREFEGVVARTSWSLQASNRSLRVEIDIPNPDRLLRPGMFVTTTILLDQRDDVLALPSSAIVWDGHDAYCCCVVGDRIDRRRVELGLRSAGDVEILSGLDADELVVLARAEALQHGQQVALLAPGA